MVGLHGTFQYRLRSYSTRRARWVVLQKVERLAQDESRMMVGWTLKVVHGLVNNTKGAKTPPDSGLGLLSNFYSDFNDTAKRDVRGFLTSFLTYAPAKSNPCYEVLCGLYSRYRPSSLMIMLLWNARGGCSDFQGGRRFI